MGCNKKEAMNNFIDTLSKYPNRLAAFVATHELGHTINLLHTVDTCGQDYALPINGFVPIMGNVEKAVSIGWVNQINYLCQMQDDRKIIGKTVKKR